MTGVTGTSFTDTGLSNGTTYYYEVSAVNTAGQSPVSSEVSVTPQAPPATPTNVTATAGNAQVALNWSASSGATSYDIYRSTTSGGEGSTPYKTGVTTPSFTDSGLTNGTTYYYEVSAVNAGGESAVSSEVSATPQAPPSPPVANAGSNVSGVEGTAIQFNGSASGGNGALIYSWNFGDGSPVTTGTLTPTHTYATSGSYTATLTVTDSAGNTSTSQISVLVNNIAPTISAGGPYSGAAGAVINFTATASVPNTSDTLTYLWNFGDDTVSTSQNPTHTYASPGTYAVSLSVTDATNGEKATTTVVTSATISATTPGLVAAYSFDEGSGTTLHDTSGNGNNGTISNATWTTNGRYGDGLVFNGTSSMVTIPEAPSLDLTTGMTLEAWVKLAASNNNWEDVVYKGNDDYFLSATSTSNGADAAGGTFGGSDVYTADSSPLPLNTWTFLTETYDGSTVSLYVNGVLVSSLAQTGNIQTSTNPLQIGGDSIYGQFFKGTIDNVRVYNSALTATQIQSDMNTPVFSAAPPPSVNAGVTLSGNEGGAFQFNGSASGGAGPLQYNWAFGDGGASAGGTATGPTPPPHVFLRDGIFTATLTVTDSLNRSATATTTVDVYNVPPTVSTGGPYQGNPGTAINFTASASVPDPKDTFSYLWSFGDGTTSTLQNPTHTYSTNGTYNVTLQVTDSEGATTTATTTATVAAPSPLAASAGPNESGNEGSAIAFSGSASGGTGALTYSWNFGDGSPATTGTLTPTHVYTSDGAYTATLTVTDSANDTVTSNTSVTVNNVAPKVSAGGPYATTVGASLSFIGTASVPDPKDTFSYLWNFGDGATSTLQNPSHTYSTAGSYNVTLQVTDSEGASTTANTTANITSGFAGLVAAYAFDEGSGTTVHDLSGNGNNGTISNATWTTAGKYGDGLVFNGTNSMVTIPEAASLDLTTGMTLEAWVNPSASNNNWEDVVYKGNDDYFLSATSYPNGADAAGGTFGGADVYTADSSALPLNTWTHIAETYDGQTVRLYVNGVLASSLAQTGNIQTSTNPLQIGGDSIYGQFFKGTIDEVRVYNVALTAQQIQTDMLTSVTPETTAPTAPGNLTATPTGTQINLSWNPSTDNVAVTSYLIERENPGSSTFTQIGTVSEIGTANPTTFSDTNVTPNNTYSYEVIATNGWGLQSQPSNVVQATLSFGISPHESTLTFGQTQQFTADLPGATWSVDGVVGGTTATGTISASGLYTAPSTVGAHTITGTSADGLHTDNATVYITNNPGVFTAHNNNSRTGANLNETVLTTANVNSTTFGKLYSYPLDDTAYAQPLYVQNVNIPGQGVHNVVYIATEHDSVYAFDADNPTAGPNGNGILWHDSFINPAAGITTVPPSDVGDPGDIVTEDGITATPVIDPTTNTMYVLVLTKEVVNGTTSYVWRLHALDITTGAEKFGGPVVIQGSVPGTGDGSSGGTVTFNPLTQNERTALTLSNGVVYLAFASHSDNPPYHGWVFGYNASTLQQVLVFNTDPNGSDDGVWQAAGMSVDASGNIYFTTGNGTFDVNTGGVDYGDSVVKISPSGTVLDYFTPTDQLADAQGDLDLGTSSPMLMPTQTGPFTGNAGPNELVQAGKDGNLYVVNASNMGKYNASNNNQIVQTLVNIFPHGGPNPTAAGNYSSPVYFNGYLYYGAVNDSIKAFSVANGLLSTTPTSQSSATYGYPGAVFSASGNGSTNGILWAVQDNGDGTEGTPPVAGVLYAYDATNLSNVLYTSTQAGARDTLGVPAKFNPPTVVNGKVFVAGANQLTVYGLLPSVYTPIAAPTVPTNVTATAGNAQVTLNWTASSGASSYNIYRSTTSGGEGSTPYKTGVTGTSFTDTGLTNGTTYYYQVSAVNASGQSPLSSEVSATPQTSIPATPTGLTATAGNAQVSLTWSASSGATSYDIYRSTTSGGEGTTPYKTGVMSTSFTDTGLTNGATYYYEVSAVNAAGQSAVSSEASATPQAPPATPTNVTATAGNAQVTLNWTASSGATSYDIYRSATSGGEGSTPYKSGVTGTSFTDTSLTNGTTYYYEVSAVNVGGQSAVSSEASATPQAPPTAPTGLTATAGNAQVTLNWTAPSGASSYNIYRSTTSGGEGSTPYKTGVTSTSFTDTGLTNGTTYYYQVSAVNVGGQSPLSSEVSATPQASVPPATPTGLTATAGNAQVTLNWTASSGATSYDIYRSTTSGGEGSTPYVTGVTATSFTDSSLSNGTTYYYEVSAVNANGQSAVTSQVSATPQAPPAAPTNVTATAGNAQVTLNWTASTGATSYDIYRSATSGGEGSTPYKTGVTGTSFTDTGLTNGTTYYYQVSAVNVGGQSPVSSEASATPQVPAPPAPTNVTATAGNAQVTLNWTASSGATSYNIYRSTTSGGEGSTPYMTGVTTTSFTDSGLTNGTTYYYEVSAVNAGGQSPVSSEVSATPQVPAPAAPTNLTATAGNAQVTLNWTASTGATSYNIYRSTTSGGEGSTPYMTGVTTTSFTDTGLTNGTTYYYEVSAVNASGQSPVTSQVSATPQAPPAAPTNVTATAGNAQVTLSWSASSGATSYDIYRSTTSGGEGNTPYKTGVTSTSFTDTGLTNGTTYYYEVSAVNSVGQSSVSSEASATPQVAAPPAPTGLTATAGNAQVSLSWTASTGATSYNIYRSTASGGEGSTPYMTGVATTSFTDSGLTNGTTYYYEVSAVNAGGQSPVSSEVSATPQAGPAGLVAAYNFDEGTGTTVHDLSGNNNNGTIVNATWSTSGKYGGALSFNGTSAMVNIPDTASLNLTTSLTLEAWVNPSAVSSAWRDVIYKGNDNYYLSATSTYSGDPVGEVDIGTTHVKAIGTSNLALNTWTFLTETYDGSNVRLYINGTQVASTAHTGNIVTSTNALQIGGDSIYGQYFKGLIDNIRVFNTALTASQITTDMNTAVTSATPSIAVAATPPTPTSAAGTLTQSQTQPVLAAATANGSAAGTKVSQPSNQTAPSTTLPGPSLALTTGPAIWLNANTANSGWFFNAIPWSYSALNTPASPASQGHVDLLTVLEHVLGISENPLNAGDTAELNAAGTQLTPTAEGDKLDNP
jgi:fibronectin type 3 domain-containing protein